jgi:subtilisin family serine protease
MRKLTLYLTTFLLLTGNLLAGHLSPGLAQFLDGMAEEEMITVMLAMSDQADIATLSEQLQRTQAPLAQRHEEVVSLLQQTALTSQVELLQELESLQEANLVAGWTSHWLSNMVIVRTNVATVRQLALREDVEQAELDLIVTMIEPVQIDHDKTAPLNRSVVDGVDNIEADRVWYELGIFGEGAIVAGIDTGVMGSHVSFASRWQGNGAVPDSEGWLDTIGGTTTPNDGHGHGTHTMGTMVGASSDTIGVAPGANWIATNPIDQGTGGGFDNDVIAALEWVCDPDGDPGTVDDMADVAQNSWGVNENFAGYYDCDSRWWDAIDNCEAAGTVLTWSAGNEGPSPTSLRSPSDRADSPLNCFSVGSTLRYPPFTISNFSSRGPSGCGGPYAVKPEICAPGSDIYSAYNTGGYTTMSGTSMAGPHIAGVVGLMRSANPDIDVETIKQILIDTAIDLGPDGEDNTYGWGFVDAYEAVLAVMQGYGTLQGVVTSNDTGLPIAGALVRNVDGLQADNTDDDGEYTMYLPAGEYTIEYSAFGYLSDTEEVDVPEDVIIINKALSPAATAVLSGHVYDPDGSPMSGAQVNVLDTPLDPVFSDGTGYYTLEMPVGATYTVRAWSAGWGANQYTIEFTEDMTLDFTLVELTLEDFESGDFGVYPWEMGGNTGWIMDSTPYEGDWCAESGNISHNQSSSMEVTLNITAAGDISFMYRVSSEANYDYLRFHIDGSEQVSWSGTVAWAEYTVAVAEGEHTFRWSYSKDGSVDNGSDCGWVDYIIFPPMESFPMPDISVEPEAYAVTLNTGEVQTEPLTIFNEGDGVLEYTIAVSQGVPQTSVSHLELQPGIAADPYPVQNDRDQGGPDGYGHLWIDSDEAGGPAFSWVEINDTGNQLTPADDICWGPFQLGFEFDFYGVTYNEVYISSNGLLSFDSDSDANFNQGIPNSAEPNTLIAPFWDNLNPATGGMVYYYNDQVNQRFIVEWDEVNHFYNTNPETFQVILYANGTILFQYQEVALSTSCTVGIEDQSGTDGLQISFNSSYLHDNLAILITSDAVSSWLSVSPVSGSVQPYSENQLEVTFDASDLPNGAYNGFILINSNDPDEGMLEIPVTLEVGLQDVSTSTLPTEVTLSQNYPNPFNPTTTIEYTLRLDGPVELALFNLRGQQVMTLVDGFKAAGSHTVQLDGSSLATGLYFYRLAAGNDVISRKMMLIK